ncbi:MAG: hypothetical protein U0326_01500 [Polyangiales bacterium]
MRSTKHRHVALATSLAASLASTAALSQDLQCRTCEDCSQLLSTPNARVELGTDLALHGAGPCVVIRGEGARFNGHGHVILAQPAGGVALRVEAANAVARHLRVTGADVGVELVGARDATLYDITAEARAKGFSVERSPNARFERVHASGGRVGLSFGASANGSCDANTTMQSPGAVVLRSTFERATTGIAACDARPVLTGNTVSRNAVGVVLGDPAAGTGPGGAAPYDACACAPTVEAVHPGTVAVYSSGCGSCQVHEGWMPGLRRRGADIVVRESGPDTQSAQERFDRFGWRCMPGVMDSLGIPGCVPNYACVTSGAFSKRREGDAQLMVDVPINGADDAFRFASECAEGARGRYARGARCVLQGLADNRICGNRTLDLSAVGGASRAGGARDRCDHAEGWSEGGHAGCALTCDEAVPSTEAPPPREPALIEPQAGPSPNAIVPDTTQPPATPLVLPTAAPPSPAGSVAPAVRTPTRTSPAAQRAPSADEPLYIVGGIVAAVLVGAWAFRKKG